MTPETLHAMRQEIEKLSAASTLGEAFFVMAQRPRLAQKYNSLKSSRLSNLLQTEIPGTRGIHLPGFNRETIAALSDNLSHPETAAQVVLPFGAGAAFLSRLIRPHLKGLEDLS